MTPTWPAGSSAFCAANSRWAGGSTARRNGEPMRRTDIVRARAVALVLAIGTVAWLHAEADVALPRAADSLKFAVIGDNGTGEPPQYDVARQIVASRSSFPFDFVLMLGDNM